MTGKRKKRYMVDPPMGSCYGFPAEQEDNYRQQLLKAGYPESEIDFAIKYTRRWEI